MGVGTVLLFPVKFALGMWGFLSSTLGIISEEAPRHEVLRRVSGGQIAYELRRYAAIYAAEVVTKGENVSPGAGFMDLAGYIGVTGPAANTEGQKMSMVRRCPPPRRRLAPAAAGIPR